MDLVYRQGPYALSGNVKKLLESARELDIDKKEALRFLRGEPAFTLHRPRRVRFARSKTVVPPRVDSTWQADLVEMQDPKLVRHNRRTRYLLTVVDVLSKFAWVVASSSKTGRSVRNAFLHIFESSGRRPEKLQTDKGKEFYNGEVRELLDEMSIAHYSTEGEPKAAVAERFNRTLKELTFKHMTLHNSYEYVDALPVLVGNYNRTVHSRTKMAPVDVDTPDRARYVWNNLFGADHKNKTNFKPYGFREGDFVRTSKSISSADKRKGAFDNKTYKGVWSRAVTG